MIDLTKFFGEVVMVPYPDRFETNDYMETLLLAQTMEYMIKSGFLDWCKENKIDGCLRFKKIDDHLVAFLKLDKPKDESFVFLKWANE